MTKVQAQNSKMNIMSSKPTALAFLAPLDLLLLKYIKKAHSSPNRDHGFDEEVDSYKRPHIKQLLKRPLSLMLTIIGY